MADDDDRPAPADRPAFLVTLRLSEPARRELASRSREPDCAGEPAFAVTDWLWELDGESRTLTLTLDLPAPALPLQ